MSDRECLGTCRFFEEHPGRFGPVEPILIRSLCRSDRTRASRILERWR